MDTGANIFAAICAGACTWQVMKDERPWLARGFAIASFLLGGVGVWQLVTRVRASETFTGALEGTTIYAKYSPLLLLFVTFCLGIYLNAELGRRRKEEGEVVTTTHVRAPISVTPRELGISLEGQTTIDALHIFREHYQGKVIRASGSVEDEAEGAIVIRAQVSTPAFRVSALENLDAFRRERPEEGYGWVLVDGVITDLASSGQTYRTVLLSPSRLLAGAGKDGQRVSSEQLDLGLSEAPALTLEGRESDGRFVLSVTNEGASDRFSATIVRCAGGGGEPRAPWSLSPTPYGHGTSVELGKNETVSVELARKPDDAPARTLVFSRSGYGNVTAKHQNQFEITVVFEGTKKQYALEAEIWLHPNRNTVDVQAKQAVRPDDWG